MCLILSMVLFLFLACLLPHLLATSCPVDIHPCFTYLGLIAVTQRQKVIWPWWLWISRRLTSMVFSSLLPCSINQCCWTSGHGEFWFCDLTDVSGTSNISRCQRTRRRMPCWYIHALYFSVKALLSMMFIKLSNWLLVSLTTFHERADGGWGLGGLVVVSRLPSSYDRFSIVLSIKSIACLKQNYWQCTACDNPNLCALLRCWVLRGKH